MVPTATSVQVQKVAALPMATVVPQVHTAEPAANPPLGHAVALPFLQPTPTLDPLPTLPPDPPLLPLHPLLLEAKSALMELAVLPKATPAPQANVVLSIIIVEQQLHSAEPAVNPPLEHAPAPGPAPAAVLEVVPERLTPTEHAEAPLATFAQVAVVVVPMDGVAPELLIAVKSSSL